MNEEKNILGTAPIGSLIVKFAVPAVIANLINAIYNIVDQIFIGHSVGELGNAATNVVFPLVTLMAAITSLIGVGGASNFSLRLGEKKRTMHPNM